MINRESVLIEGLLLFIEKLQKNIDEILNKANARIDDLEGIIRDNNIKEPVNPVQEC